MPLTQEDIVRVLANAARRVDGGLILGTWEDASEPYFAGVGDATDYCEYHNAKTPEDALNGLFDDGLKEGLFERQDFDLTTLKLPLYRLAARHDESTLRWLRVFRTTKYLRIPFPEGETPPKPDNEDFRYEFVIKTPGGPDSAVSVVQWVRDT